MIIPGGPVMDLQNSSHELLLKLSLEPRKLKSRASVMSLQPSPVRMCFARIPYSLDGGPFPSEKTSLNSSPQRLSK